MLCTSTEDKVLVRKKFIFLERASVLLKKQDTYVIKEGHLLNKLETRANFVSWEREEKIPNFTKLNK